MSCGRWMVNGFGMEMTFPEWKRAQDSAFQKKKKIEKKKGDNAHTLAWLKPHVWWSDSAVFTCAAQKRPGKISIHSSIWVNGCKWNYRICLQELKWWLRLYFGPLITMLMKQLRSHDSMHHVQSMIKLQALTKCLFSSYI